MSGREWQPGDVAMRHGAYDSMVGLFVSPCGIEAHGLGCHWHYANGGWSPADTVTRHASLVVIDPENREQVERLARTTHIALTGNVPAWETLSGKDQVRRMDALVMALYADLTPLKPDEPQGLGAVVEDAKGNTYTRVDKGTLPWFTTHAEGNAGRCDWTRWDRIKAVRVLSEGVTP